MMEEQQIEEYLREFEDITEREKKVGKVIQLSSATEFLRLFEINSSLSCDRNNSTSEILPTESFHRDGVHANRKIPPRLKQVIQLRFDLLNNAVELRSYKQIGEELGISPERARQLAEQSLARIALALIKGNKRSQFFVAGFISRLFILNIKLAY